MNQKVDPDRIKGVAERLERLRSGWGEETTSLGDRIGNILKDVGSKYHEPRVQSAIYEVESVLQRYKKHAGSFDKLLGSKAETLRRVAQDYVRVEMEAEQKVKEAIMNLTVQAETLALALGGPGTGTGEVASTPKPEEVEVNEANLNMLLQQFLNERGYALFPADVRYAATTTEHAPEFLEFALHNGYDPETFEYLEYKDRSAAYLRFADNQAHLEQDSAWYKEHLLDGYETLAFGRGFYLGLENSVNHAADVTAQIVAHPLDSGEAALKGIAQVFIDIAEEADKFKDDPVGYVKQGAINQWTSIKDLYTELSELSPSKRWERIGQMMGDHTLSTVTSIVGGGIAAQVMKKVSIVVKSKIDFGDLKKADLDGKDRLDRLNQGGDVGNLDQKLKKYVCDSFEGTGKEAQDNFNKFLRDRVWSDETLSNAEKIKIMIANFNKLTPEQKKDFNVLNEHRVLKNPNYTNWGEWPDTDWPNFPGLDKGTAIGVFNEETGEILIPTDLDRIGSPYGNNLGVVEEGHHSTQNERSICYIENEFARNSYQFINIYYKDTIDAIKDFNIDQPEVSVNKINSIIDQLNELNGTDNRHVTENTIANWYSQYKSFQSKPELINLCNEGGIDSTYGVMGKAAPWITNGEEITRGGAGQINTPINVKALEDIGILLNKGRW